MPTKIDRRSVTIETVKQLVRDAGFTPSAGSWEDERRIVAFSVESYGPGTYGSSKCLIEYKKDREMFYRNNQQLSA